MRQILCFGDSNTYGLIPGTANRYSWGTRWTSILDEKLQFYGYRVAEEGLCGRTTMFADAYRPGRSGIDMLPAHPGDAPPAGTGGSYARDKRLQSGLGDDTGEDRRGH